MQPSTVLVVGGTGGTGRLLVMQLLERGCRVRAVVRSADRLPETVRDHPALEVIQVSVADLTDDALAEHVRGCSSAASCLGHTLSFRGIYGKPRRVVADTARRLCAALAEVGDTTAGPCRFVLMNSAGCRNRGLDEPVPLAQHAVLALLRVLVPPHADNEQATEHLRLRVAPGGPVQWVVVRPDTLVDKDEVSSYDLHASPTRSAIFNAGKTRRVNVAHVMATLLTDDAMWAAWQGQMPVVYDRVSPA